MGTVVPFHTPAGGQALETFFTKDQTMLTAMLLLIADPAVFYAQHPYFRAIRDEHLVRLCSREFPQALELAEEIHQQVEAARLRAANVKFQREIEGADHHLEVMAAEDLIICPRRWQKRSREMRANLRVLSYWPPAN